MDRVIELLAEVIELLLHQQHQQQQQEQQEQQQQEQQEQQQPRVRKVVRMLDIVARLPIDFIEVEGGFAYITHSGRRRVKVVLPNALRGAAPSDLRDVLFAFSVDLMEHPNGRRFTSIRGRPIEQGEAKNRLVLRAGMVEPLAEEISTLPGISWCSNGIEKILAQMIVVF